MPDSTLIVFLCYDQSAVKTSLSGFNCREGNSAPRVCLCACAFMFECECVCEIVGVDEIVHALAGIHVYACMCISDDIVKC